jgi:hypothetical protein
MTAAVPEYSVYKLMTWGVSPRPEYCRDWARGMEGRSSDVKNAYLRKPVMIGPIRPKLCARLF